MYTATRTTTATATATATGSSSSSTSSASGSGSGSVSRSNSLLIKFACPHAEVGPLPAADADPFLHPHPFLLYIYTLLPYVSKLNRLYGEHYRRAC